MRQIPPEQLPDPVRAAVRDARKSHPLFGPGVRVCIARQQARQFAEVEVANAQQASRLAVDLVGLGYFLTTEPLDDCDFLLTDDAQGD